MTILARVHSACAVALIVGAAIFATAASAQQFGPGRDLKEQAEKYDNPRAIKLISQLCDLGDKRIAEMDRAGIDMQIVSLTAPGVEQLEASEATALATETNDFIADAIKKHPTRFGGFAALPTAVPDKGAQELERRVKGQKFAGAIINGHNRGRYLDDKFFWPILECAEKIGAPIYLHPTRPPKRPITGYLRENLHYTFSGFFFPATFLSLLLELGGVDRIMFSIDHPYQSMAEGRAFLEQLPVSAADKERIANGNAEKLFKL
jgi:predicted TIM-barrel fold metal-dependent hydrolase